MRFGALLAAVLAAGSGCATGPPASLASRFIVPGRPAIDLSAPAGSPRSPGAPSPAPAVPSAEAAPPRSTVVAATLEATSPLLRARLAALAASPTPDAHLDVAAAYASFGIHDRAFDYLAAGLARYPQHAGLHEAAARLWRDWGLPEQALRHAHLAARYAPDSAAAASTLGTVLWALDARIDATAAFARAFALEPAAPWARTNWCTAVVALGRPRPFACDGVLAGPLRSGPAS